jgi:hypothetical protein
MKVESIVFDCPLLFRGSIDDSNVQKIVAQNIDDYVLNPNIFLINKEEDTYSNCIYLIAVKIDNDLFVIQKSHKLKKLTKVANTLSAKLNATIVVVKAMLSGVHNIELYNVYTADHLTEDDLAEE